MSCRLLEKFPLDNFPESIASIEKQFQNKVRFWHYSSRTCFCWCLLGPANTRPWCHEPFSQNSLKIPTVPFGIVACTFALFSDKLSRKSCISRRRFGFSLVSTWYISSFSLHIKHILELGRTKESRFITFNASSYKIYLYIYSTPWEHDGRLLRRREWHFNYYQDE